MLTDVSLWVALLLLALAGALSAVVAASYGRLNAVSLRRNTVRMLHLSRALDTLGADMDALRRAPLPLDGLTRARAFPVGGGGTTLAALSLAVLPAWSEQRVIADDGSPASQHDNLCGEVCVSAIVAAVHGVPTDPTDHRTHAHGLSGPALTNGDDIAGMLQHCNVGATGRLVGWADAHSLITARLAEGCYTVALVAPPWVGFVLHWIIPVGHGSGGYNVFDPWDGVYRTVGDNDMARWYSGQLVTTSAHPHYNATGWEMPPL